MSPTLKALNAALKAASRKIALASVKHRNANLEMCAGDLAEAYEIGVEEAQSEIVERIQKMIRAEVPK